MTEVDNSKYHHKAGVDISPNNKPEIVFSNLVTAAQKHFCETNLVKPGPIGEPEIEAVTSFYQEAAEINPEVFNSSTRQHLELTERYAQLIGQTFNTSGANLDIYKLKIGALLHDVGRTFSHRRGRNDRAGHLILKKVGVRQEIQDTIPPDEKFAPSKTKFPGNKSKEYMESIDDLTGEQSYRGIVMIADVLAKFIGTNENRRLRRWQEVVEQTNKRQNRPDESTMWPIEVARQQLILDNFDSVAILYNKIGKWAEEQMGCSLEEIVDLMEDSLKEQPLTTKYTGQS